jgi:hypothetical protein
MTYKAGFVFNIGDLIDFGGEVGVFDLALFIVDPDVFNIFPRGDFVDNAVDVVSQVVHHGIVSTELNRGGQGIGTCNNTIHQLFFLVFDIKKGPDRNTQDQAQAYQREQFGYQAAADIL